MKFHKTINKFGMALFCLLGFALPLDAQQKEPCSKIKWYDGGYAQDWERTQSGPKLGARPKNFALICPPKDFKKFLKSFSEDAHFQAAAILFPLKSSFYYYDKLDAVKYQSVGKICDSETETCSDYLDPPKGHKGGFHIFPTKKERACENLIYKIKSDKNNPNIMVVSLYEKNEGTSFDYIFAWDGCWFLVEIGR